MKRGRREGGGGVVGWGSIRMYCEEEMERVDGDS